MKKVIRDGNVAVLYSPGYGAGWSTWCYNNDLVETLLFHPLIVEKVESGLEKEITTEWLVQEFGREFEGVYCGGAGQLEIEWLPEGTAFRIDEYDGFETVITNEHLYYIA